MSASAREYARDRLSVIEVVDGAAFRDRFYLNALSSQPLAFSVAGELRAHPVAASRVLADLSGRPLVGLDTLAGQDEVVPEAQKVRRRYVPLERYTLDGIEAEWFPPRWAHTDDRSGFDIAVCAASSSGQRTLVSIEVKYTDSFSSGTVTWDRYGSHLAAIGVDESVLPDLVHAGCSQVLRQVMLTRSVQRSGLAPGVDGKGLVDDVLAVVLAREDDNAARRVVDLVNGATDVEVQFWSHRDLLASAAKEKVFEEWAGQMADRYLLPPG